MKSSVPYSALYKAHNDPGVANTAKKLLTPPEVVEEYNARIKAMLEASDSDWASSPAASQDEQDSSAERPMSPSNTNRDHSVEGPRPITSSPPDQVEAPAITRNPKRELSTEPSWLPSTDRPKKKPRVVGMQMGFGPGVAINEQNARPHKE